VPVLFVKKKDGLLYLYVDFHGLNYITKKNHYSLLLISNLLNSSHKAQVYTKIDLYHAYHLIYIADNDEWKTTFKTCYKLFEWFIIVFGLTNILVVFQWFISNSFSNILDVCIIIYLDNILIYSNNIEFVLQALKKSKSIDKYYLLHDLPLEKLKRTEWDFPEVIAILSTSTDL